jgi:hypothetical protein
LTSSDCEVEAVGAVRTSVGKLAEDQLEQFGLDWKEAGRDEDAARAPVTSSVTIRER